MHLTFLPLSRVSNQVDNKTYLLSYCWRDSFNQFTVAWYVSNFMQQGKDERSHTDLASSEIFCFEIYKQIGSMTGITNVDKHNTFRIAFLSF